MLTVPTVDELSAFNGRPVTSFSAFATQALLQSALMFTVVTKLTDYPDDPDLRDLAKNAILEMADRLLLEQPYQFEAVGPYQSETIGSYSYSRVTATSSKASQGLKTGLLWWDLAVSELSVGSSNITEHGSVKVLPDGLTKTGDTTYKLQSPAESEDDWPPYVRIS